MIHAKFVGRNRPENETLLYLLLRVEMVVFIAGRFFLSLSFDRRM